MSKRDIKCKKCGKCCRFIVLWLDRKPIKDFIRWANLHGEVEVIKEGKHWMIRFESKCFMLEKNQCLVYKNRPKICKEYKCWEKGFPKP